MNNERRKILNHIREQLDDYKSIIEAMREAEQEAFDNMPESFQCGERGDKATDAIDNLDYVILNLEESVEYLQQASE